MAVSQSTLAQSPVQHNVDLLRRYCPGLAVHTQGQVAAHLRPDTSGCWPWDGSLSDEGYGQLWCEPTPYGSPQSAPAHRYMYDLLVGEIPYGYHIHHRCHYKPCWHPLHLEPVTPKEHCARHRRAAQPHPWCAPVQLVFAFA
jgi:hypothetical protein